MVEEGNEMLDTAPHTISFSDFQWKLVGKLAKEHHMAVAEVVRRIVDFAIDYDAELGLPLLTDKRKAARAELAALDRVIRELEAKQKAGNTEPPKAVFEKPIGSANRWKVSSKVPYTDNRPGQTEEDRWRVKVGYFLNPPPNLSKEDVKNVGRSVIGDAEKHSDWLGRLPNEQQDALRENVGRGQE